MLSIQFLKHIDFSLRSIISLFQMVVMLNRHLRGKVFLFSFTFIKQRNISLQNKSHAVIKTIVLKHT